jgi:hypothetical protein
MSALITTDPATLAVVAPDGTPATADTTTGAQLTSVVAGNQVSFTGAVGAIVTRVMVGVGAYFDGDTRDTATLDYLWTGAPGASTSTESQVVPVTPGGLPPGLTWDDAACLGPPIAYGRWTDQPASLRWDQLDPAETWDTYTTGGA